MNGNQTPIHICKTEEEARQAAKLGISEALRYNSEDAAKHFGYDTLAPCCGCWPNEADTIDRLAHLPEALKLQGVADKKFRVVFDYDPDYPRSLLQVFYDQPDHLDNTGMGEKTCEIGMPLTPDPTDKIPVDKDGRVYLPGPGHQLACGGHMSTLIGNLNILIDLLWTDDRDYRVTIDYHAEDDSYNAVRAEFIPDLMGSAQGGEDGEAIKRRYDEEKERLVLGWGAAHFLFAFLVPDEGGCLSNRLGLGFDQLGQRLQERIELGVCHSRFQFLTSFRIGWRLHHLLAASALHAYNIILITVCKLTKSPNAISMFHAKYILIA